jgi:hypothetical protein
VFATNRARVQRVDTTRRCAATDRRVFQRWGPTRHRPLMSQHRVVTRGSGSADRRRSSGVRIVIVKPNREMTAEDG